ncbi:hypothetical protein KIW84_024802 [Lathyrus oleraceus]|uniref:Uncharacterized protein n=1 Tax=Pisum sativum TaxID=3888 RepID=A0A9D4YIK5_PEA|nr:hypothetical protein KIW84_024802 [Pisum sativum]
MLQRAARESHASSVSAALMAKAPATEPTPKPSSYASNSQLSPSTYRGHRGKKPNRGGRNSGRGNRGQQQQQQWQPWNYPPWQQWGPWNYPHCPYPTSYLNRPNNGPKPQQNGILGPKPQPAAFNVNTTSPTDIESAFSTLNLAQPDPSWEVVAPQERDLCNNTLLDSVSTIPQSRKAHVAHVAWKTVCGPKRHGRLNLTDLDIWNTTTLLRLLGNLSGKSESLWEQWIHANYLKDKNIMEAQLKCKTSWMVKANLNQLG